jgi:hypothetical protein
MKEEDMADENSERAKKKSLWPLLAILVVLAFLIWLLAKIGGRPLLEVVSQFGEVAVKVAGIIFTVLAGTFLYFFRCRWPFSYGFLEILIGALAALYVAGQFLEPVNGKGMLVFAWIAGLYVIVRGWDNIHKAQSGSQRRLGTVFGSGRSLTQNPNKRVLVPDPAAAGYISDGDERHRQGDRAAAASDLRGADGCL